MSVKKWKNMSMKQRRQLFKKCGSKCFLKPKGLKFPVCDTDCKFNENALQAAYIRAKQWGYASVAKKAKSLMKKI